MSVKRTMLIERVRNALQAAIDADCEPGPWVLPAHWEDWPEMMDAVHKQLGRNYVFQARVPISWEG